MINKDIIMTLFDGFYMQRWNDKLRPIQLIEMDKQAHKMMIAYIIGKFEEANGAKVDWVEIIEGGIFELLQRMVLTDIKPPIFYKIKDNPEQLKKLNEYVLSELEPKIKPLGDEFYGRFVDYHLKGKNTLGRKILGAAHNFASKWEFEIIERMNPDGFEIKELKVEFDRRIENYCELFGVQQILIFHKLRQLIDLFGNLRFQIRWSHLHRIPKTSVIGHSLFVAILSYLFSLEIKACDKRRYNNFFTGLFHDLPEVLTRDIISPVKSKGGLEELVKEVEKDELEQRLYPLVPDIILPELKLLIENEFENFIFNQGKHYNKITSEEISKSFNDASFNPRDGVLIRAADKLSAFVEAFSAKQNGCVDEEFLRAINYIKDDYKNTVICGLNFGGIYSDFV